MINVLLVSPRLGLGDPRHGGDHTYTDILLENPPSGVRYLHYEKLIAQGKMRRIRHLNAIGYKLVRAGLLPPDMWAEYLATDAQPDIVHVYGFSAVVRLKYRQRHVPVILGAGTGSYSDLKYYHGWDDGRIKHARAVKRAYLRLVDAYDSSLRPERAFHIVTWSDFSRRMHLDEGYVRPDQISVLHPGLAAIPTDVHGQSLRDVTFLFIGRDFERKNGPSVLAAFRRVHDEFPRSRLILIGHPAHGNTIVEPGVTHKLFVSRQELFNTVYPKADVLILPSRAEGFGLVIVEAMAHGIPAIAVNAWAMPEIIRDGLNGYLILPNSVDEMANRMLRFASQPGLLASMRKQSIACLHREFSIEVHNQRLMSLYMKALAKQP